MTFEVTPNPAAFGSEVTVTGAGLDAASAYWVELAPGLRGGRTVRRVNTDDNGAFSCPVPLVGILPVEPLFTVTLLPSPNGAPLATVPLSLAG